MPKSILQIIYSCSVQKTDKKKPLNIRKMTPFSKSAIMPLQNPHFRSKIKILKNMSKSILQIINSCSGMPNESILKIGHHAKAIAFAISSFGGKN